MIGWDIWLTGRVDDIRIRAGASDCIVSKCVFTSTISVFAFALAFELEFVFVLTRETAVICGNVFVGCHCSGKCGAVAESECGWKKE